jgi:putative two-component system response regulator
MEENTKKEKKEEDRVKPPPGDIRPPKGTKKTILVIDDDMTSLTAIRKMLENIFEVCLAKSANMAWNILNNTLIDLILLDVEMPTMSGLEFMEYLRRNNAFQFIPVIFVTSHAQQDIILKARKSGAKGFIVKPVSPDLMMEKIKSVLEEAADESDREAMLKKLHLLDMACKTGKIAEAEKLIEELSRQHHNVGTDGAIGNITKEIRQLNYPAAIERIADLIKNNLFDIKK